MHIEVFCVNPFQTNCIVCHDGTEAILIDPGTYAREERDAVLAYIREQRLVLQSILLTHAHIDHVFGLASFVSALGTSYAMHRDDLPLINEVHRQAATFGIEVDDLPQPGSFLAEGDQVHLGGAVWEVLHTPGHSPGSISFLDRTNRLVVAGDVLFRGSIGRTDLWQGSLPQLMESIYQKLMVLPDDYVVYPGHGPATTIGDERTTNPFLQ